MAFQPAPAFYRHQSEDFFCRSCGRRRCYRMRALRLDRLACRVGSSMTGPFLHHETSLFETQSGRVPGSLDIACRNPRSALIDAIFVMQGKLAQLETDGFNDRELERLRAAIPAASGGD